MLIINININKNKIMLCVWWNVKEILHYKLLKLQQTVSANLYRK